MTSCSSSSKATDLFGIQLEGNQKTFTKGAQVGIALNNKKDTEVTSISYSLDGESLPVTNGKVVFNPKKLGSKVLKATVSYGDKTAEITKDIKVLAEDAPDIYTYEVINTFPHDIKAFTQGLEFYDGVLYESTGIKGESSLRKVNFETGEILQEVALDDTLFGEGITILNNKVYLLTWQSGLGFVYDATSLEKTGSFTYGNSKEGWGLCNDGTSIYKSDGTEKIWKLDPDSLTEKEYIQTVTNRSVFNKTNELEYVDGKIYANVWQKPSMMIIDANSGAIEGVINFSGLKNRVKQHSKLDVLNGVAYHPERGTFFVTGKRWNKLFEVKIKKK
ncbi:glutaminyl-peptide cyclotransferase [Croceivirga sp. JEA036]|uniref:glutaminyl-peptide cyclotransferase n=1 Tax=Croceivirga sp. JEA036 TaxID=2721162 RepID=UPI001439C264|nr:glutaminyl-peptide cyclotransferase [Croceivirga sp. JEA036]NJB35834.1 glutaminyl-peptide cyclotransferase [Croceivirga sp. JEA036]